MCIQNFKYLIFLYIINTLKFELQLNSNYHENKDHYFIFFNNYEFFQSVRRISISQCTT